MFAPVHVSLHAALIELIGAEAPADQAACCFMVRQEEHGRPSVAEGLEQ